LVSFGGSILPSSRAGPEERAARFFFGVGFFTVTSYSFSICAEGWAIRWAKEPSLVRRRRPVVAASRRPTGTRPGKSGIRSLMIGRLWPGSSLRVVR
jgi:hypothetical protein